MKLSDFQAAIGILVMVGIALQLPWGAILTMATALLVVVIAMLVGLYALHIMGAFPLPWFRRTPRRNRRRNRRRKPHRP